MNDLPRPIVQLEQSFLVQRRGMAVLAALLPVAFLVSSFVLHRTAFQTSISAYYWARDLERNIFVGALGSVAIAVASRLLPGDFVLAMCERSAVFWFEAVGIWAFSAFWYIKTRELDPTASWIPFRTRRSA